MRSLAVPLTLLLAAGCAAGTGREPSLAPRAAEAVDPRLPISAATPSGPVDPVLARQLETLIGPVREGAPSFIARQTEAERLAAAAGPMSSESWIAAQQALSQLVEQFGVASRAAADIDALAASRLKGERWISPADQAAISAAAAEVAAIGGPQAEAIDRLTAQLTR